MQKEPVDHDPLKAYEDDYVSDTTHHPFTAFNQGFEAARRSLDRNLNPYRTVRKLWSDWWYAGYEEFISQDREATRPTKNPRTSHLEPHHNT